MNKSKYQEALKRLLRNRYNSNIKLVGTDYGLKEVRSITKKGRLKKQEDITLIQALVDKATPKKVLYLTIVDTPDNTYLNGNCPNCHYIVDSTNMVEKYCQYCGQALDWSEDE